MANRVEDLKLNIARAEKLADGTTAWAYEIGSYNIFAVTSNGKIKEFRLGKKAGCRRFVPDLYCFRDIFSHTWVPVKVQTTSYGTITVEELEEYMQEMAEAMEVAKRINKYFFNK